MVASFFSYTGGEGMANLADILVTLTLDTKEFNSQLKRVSAQLKGMTGEVKQQTVAMEKSVQDSTKKMSKDLDRVGTSSRTLARNMGTSSDEMNKVLQTAQKEFELFGDRSLSVSKDVKEEFRAMPKHLQRYIQRLRDAGKSTEEWGELNKKYSAVIIERYKRTNDYIQNKTMQSTKLIQNLNNTKLSRLSQQFLRLGEHMERTATKGKVLNIALQRLGENASLKQMKDEIKYIEQGIGRARGSFIGFGILSALSLYGLILMSNEIDGRLIPAFDRFKEAWTGALEPFVNAFTTFVVWVMDGVTAVGNLMKAFAEAHPQLSQMLWGIILLTMVLGTLLSPLAVGIGLFGGMAATFAKVWAIIKPFVLGMLTVAGTALIIATAIVVVVAVINNLWKASENFRNAWINIWDNVKTAFVENFSKPVSKAWDNLKQAFSDLISFITGGGGTMGDLWEWLGDKIAIAVEYIGQKVLPILSNAFSIMGTIVSGVLNGLAFVMGWLTQKWEEHGDTVLLVVGWIWTKIQEVFSIVHEFLASKMPQIQEIVSKAFNLIKVAIDFVMEQIVPRIINGFNWVYEHFGWIFPLLWGIVKSTWDNIKNIISSALNIIEGVIDLFTSILTGNWSGAWEAVKSILKNAVSLVWSLIQVTFVGKIFKIFKAMPGNIWGFLKSLGAKIAKPFKDGYNSVKKWITDMVSKVKSKFGDMKSGIGTALSGLKDKITKPFKDAWNFIKDIPKKIKDGFNKMKIKIPKFKIPKVSIEKGTKNFMGKDIPYPKIKVNWNAKGNIFNGASVLGGGQGVGEAGAEVVMPIQHKRYMKPFASAVADHLDTGVQNNGGANQYTVQFNEPVIIREDADITRIVDEIEKRQRKQQRARGLNVY